MTIKTYIAILFHLCPSFTFLEELLLFYIFTYYFFMCVSVFPEWMYVHMCDTHGG